MGEKIIDYEIYRIKIGKFWIAKKRIDSPVRSCPYYVRSDWEEVKEEERNRKYKGGDVVFDLKQDYRFWSWKQDRDNWVKYDINKHLHWTLTKFTPPIIPNTDNNFDVEAAKHLAIRMAVQCESHAETDDYNWKQLQIYLKKQRQEIGTLRNDYPPKSEYDVIKDFNVKLQQTNITNKLNSYLWRDVRK